MSGAGAPAGAQPGAGGESHARSALLELSEIEKAFGASQVLRGANLSASAGEIVGLCGEKGTGKSTLVQIMAGVLPFRSYRGQVVLDGIVPQFAGPWDAREAGIAVVHQKLMLVPELTVAQNLMLGREPRRFGLVDEPRLEAIAQAELARFGFAGEIEVQKPVSELGIGLQQIVEIVRALALEARILILDEPTAALTHHEADLLMGWLKTLREQGTTCIYVSHRLDELFALCDRLTVLRDGRTAATLDIAATTPEEVVSAMVGRKVSRGRASDVHSTSSAPVL